MRQIILIISLLLAFVNLNSIQVSGNQSGNWIPENNPYQIIGDITVPTGSTLNVLPGVIVEATGNFQITAQGNIIAVGTEADSIKFKSGMPNQTTLWKGIRLENTSLQSQFRNCLIELGQYGINSINSPASIMYCHFNKNQKGIQAYGIGSTTPATVLIDHNLIEYSQQSGIYVVQNSNTEIQYNEIRFNGTAAAYYGAIQLANQSDGGSCSPEIANNHIHHNYKQGITAWDTVSANAIQPEIHDNLVENNLTGIYLRHASGYTHHNTVINNFIAGNMNSGAGIMVSGNTAQPYFEDNIITGNYTGFYLTENANPVLGDMSIYHAWAQGGNTISNNIDANNVRHTIACYSYTAATFTVKAENNTWDYDTAAEIDATITDYNDNPAFPTIDYDPWITNAIPIYLAGTIISTNPQMTSAELQLISYQTGNIINQWTVQCNSPFQVPVYHDSLVYIVATGRDLSQVQYMAAYGGLQNPTATQIIADVQFYVGDLTLINELPNWSTYKVGIPELINEHLSYPIIKNWFVMSPTQKLWLFRDGDYLRMSRYSLTQSDSNEVFDNYDLPSAPVWRKIANLNSDDSWQQFISYDPYTPTLLTGNATATAGIIYTSMGSDYLYDIININGGLNDKQIQVYDINSNYWIDYKLNTDYTVQAMESITPILVEPDGTMFPTQTGNVWKSYLLQQDTVPTYFGYIYSDSLMFYWIPPRSGVNMMSFKLYDNGVLITELPLSTCSYTVPIQYDGIEHTYTLAAWDGTNNNFALVPIVLIFTHAEDEIATPQPFSAYPNPFNPALFPLTVKYDVSKTKSAKLSIYNLKGQLVWKTDVNTKATELNWNGRDNNGTICASGLYQMQLIDNKGHKTHRKLMLIH